MEMLNNELKRNGRLSSRAINKTTMPANSESDVGVNGKPREITQTSNRETENNSKTVSEGDGSKSRMSFVRLFELILNYACMRLGALLIY